MRKLALVTAVALAAGAVLSSGLLASASTATVGASIQLLPSGGYLGDKPGSYSSSGDAPIVAGSSRSYTVLCGNAGNVTENLSLVQTPGFPWDHASPQVPVSWVTASPANISNVAPGGSFTSTVILTVPTGTAPGRYIGVVYCNAANATPGSGISGAAGAGIREYVQVLAPALVNS